MSLPFNIRADLTLSYFVILFFNYLHNLHVLPSSIHFVIFKNSFLLNHEDPRYVPHTNGNNMVYTIHSWVLYMHVYCTSCPNTFINIAVQNPWLGLISMTTTNLPTELSFWKQGYFEGGKEKTRKHWLMICSKVIYLLEVCYIVIRISKVIQC
jgi:hypothetical protein